MDLDDTISNTSDNRTFEDVLGARLTRRTVMAGGLATAAATLFGGTAFASRPVDVRTPSLPRRGRDDGGIGFTSIPLQNSAWPTIAPEYQWSVLIPWREKLDGSGTSFDYGLTADQQAASIGIGHDGMWYFGSDKRGMLCINHEFGTTPHVIGKAAPTSIDDVRIMQHAHGVSVVKIERSDDTGPTVWSLKGDKRNRRIHVNTPVVFSGPAASSPLLQTAAGNPTLGTLNNCANGYTPWGTYLTCEENFNGYFGRTVAGPNTPEQARYGFSAGGFGYEWHKFDPRFDLSNPAYANEENRFGWVVEIDPERPKSAPVKRTALGRVKHEGATFVEGKGGRAVVYTGDDERFDYIYRYVSARNWRSMRARGISPLDEGTLYVAKFNDDGTGEWLELTPNNPALAGWTLDRILVHTRLAADAVGATKMDRPEWITQGADGQMYCTLTNNTNRGVGTNPGVNAANPIVNNRWGHIIRWTDSERYTGATFTWDIFLIAQDVADGGGQMFGSPDGLWADPDGRVFIQTDGTQPGANNDQMLVADSATKEIRRLFTGVKSCEVTGVAVTPDRRTMFVNLQHPGDGNPANSNFPVGGEGIPADPAGPIPRDATIVITRRDGKVIGS